MILHIKGKIKFKHIICKNEGLTLLVHTKKKEIKN